MPVGPGPGGATCSAGLADGPAWRGIDRHHGRRPRAGGLHRNSIRQIITRRAGRRLRRHHLGCALAAARFATEAIARGVPERDVQRHGRWRSRACMEPYIDAARAFDPTNPTRWLT